jgi:hypothetical protein
MARLPDPSPASDARFLLLEYLDFYRATVADKLDGLSERELRTSRLPSGWSPLELLRHLVFMERRWLVWGFLGEQVDEPWGDDREGRWHVPDDESPEHLLRLLRDGGVRTRRIVEGHDLADSAAVGGRFAEDPPPPSLMGILFHVLQEYARHAGHLDIARELADGTVGE